MPVTSVKAAPAAKVIPNTAKGKTFTTVDGGRLHVAADDKYVGSINSYNNWFTKFFARLFGWSEDVTFNGKVRCVEKKDYMNFLSTSTSYKEASLDRIKDYVDFNALKVVPTQDRGTMRQNISQYKSDYLFGKLVNSMVSHDDYEKAVKYVGKGANIDGQFWFRDGYGVSFSNLTQSLPNDKSFQLQAGRYTPLLYAAAKNNKLFSSYICFFNPTLDAEGETLKFERKIQEVNPHEDVVSRTNYISEDGRPLTRLQIKTISTLRMQDVRTPQYTMRYNPQQNELIWSESKERVKETNYDSQIVRYSTRYI